MAELKPCPFCGGEARIVENDPLGMGKKEFFTYGAICPSCGANFWKNTETEAEEAWNRRADNG